MNVAILLISSLGNKKEATYLTTFTIAHELMRRGHNVVIIACGAEGREIIEGVPVYRVKNKIFGYAEAVKKIEHFFDLDVLHGISSTPLFSLPLWLARYVSKKASTIHSLRSYSKSRWGNQFYFCLNLADKVTVPTKIFSQKLNGVKKSKIVLLPSSIDLKKFRPLQKQQLKSKYGFKETILFYGSLYHTKGAEVLIKAIPRIIRDYPNTKFIFIPRNKEANQQAMLIKKLGLTEHVSIILKDVAIEKYVNAADLVVLPYINMIGTEGNPSCLLEAMACKTLVVTTSHPELKEILGDCVYYAKPNDVSSLAEAVIEALNNKNNSQNKIEKAYSIARNFSSEKMINSLLPLYEELNRTKIKKI